VNAYRLAKKGCLLGVVLQTLVILRLKLRIMRLVERIHIELKRITSISD